MALVPDVSWEDRHGGRGSVKIDLLGIRVATNGASTSPPLDDVHKIRKIYEMLGDLLYARTGVR